MFKLTHLIVLNSTHVCVILTVFNLKYSCVHYLILACAVLHSEMIMIGTALRFRDMDCIVLLEAIELDWMDSTMNG